MRFAILFSYLLIGVSTITSALKGYSPADVPNPMLDPVGCGRPDVPKSAICDPALLLTKESKNVIEGFINAAQGTQISVVVIDEMNPTFVGSDLVEVASEHFARTLHNTWGVGDKETQNGILIFLSVNDRAVFISTGKGVQSKLTRQYIDYLITDMRPDLRNKEYGTAMEKTVVQIDLIMTSKSNIAEKCSDEESSPYGIAAVIAVVAVLLGIAYNERRNLIELKKGRKALENFMSEITEASENKNFLSESCPICLETFSTKAAPDTAEGDALEGQRETHTQHTQREGHTYVSTPYEEDIEDSTQRKKETDTPLPSAPPRVRDESPLRPMALHCGHVFCYECLSGFLKTRDGTKCPICRAPVSGEKPPPPAPRPPSSGPGGAGGMGGDGRGGSGGSCADQFRTSQDTYHAPHYTRPYSQGDSMRTGYYSESQSAEFMYRMHRMNYLYPRVMTSETLFTLNAALSSGTAAEFRRAASVRSAEVTRVITDIETRNAASTSGSSGSSYGSFGGGSSSGGGGGRW